MHSINRSQLLIAATLLLFVISSAKAQVVIYDWAVKGDAPKSYPTITRRQAVTVRIENVNDILFSYRMRVTQRKFDSSEFDAIAKLLITKMAPAPGVADAGNCQNLNATLQNRLEAAKKAINEDENLPIGYAARTSHPSVPLKDSLDAWRTLENDEIAKVTRARAAISTANPPCAILHEAEYRMFEEAVRKLRLKIDRPHFIEETHTLDPATHVTVTVDEIYEGETISTATFSFNTEDVLTLSAGAMFSRIQDRTYESRKNPTSELNTLTVTGNSRATPSLVALLNYSLGAALLDWERAGLALSAGPVLRVGGKSETSSFGFFTGVSGHLYRRIFFTPGFHFGQFSDFPVGFGDGSSVPANFGELTPVKRWTARFGLAITFKTKTFDAFGSSDKKIGGDEAAGGTKPKDEKSKDGANAVNSGMMDPAAALRLVSSKTWSPPQLSNSTAAETPEPDASPKAPSVASSDAAPSVYVSTSTSGGSITKITSLVARSNAMASDERVIIETSARVSDYSMYFRAGRFYLVLPRTTLQVFQDALQGQAFSDAVVEKRGPDLLLSFVLKPGTSARVVERASGLDLVFASQLSGQE